LRPKAVAVRADQITLGELGLKGCKGRVAQLREFPVLLLAVIVIKDRRRMECHLQVAVHTFATIELALDQALTACLIVGLAEARPTEAMGLRLIEEGGVGGVAESAGAVHFVLWREKTDWNFLVGGSKYHVWLEDCSSLVHPLCREAR
jgi:hypothetical protein